MAILVSSTTPRHARHAAGYPPYGVYNVTISKVVAQRPAGEEYPELVWTLRVEDAPYQGKRLRLHTSLAPIEMWRLCCILKNLGVYEDNLCFADNGKGDIIQPALAGRRARARVHWDCVLDLFAVPPAPTPAAPTEREGKETTMATPGCAVPGCDREAVVEVILYDVYQYTDDRVYDVFYDQDETCPYLCLEHLSENEARCKRVRLDLPAETPLLSGQQILDVPEIREPAGRLRGYRGDGPDYPYTNRYSGNGFSIYRPLKGRSL